MNVKLLNYPDYMTQNCERGSVQVRFLPLGAKFRLDLNGYGHRDGVVEGHGSARTEVRWTGLPSKRSFLNHRTGEKIEFIVDNNRASSVCSECPVIPL
jgi:hypothetical protein